MTMHGGSGLGVDSEGGPVIDPTKNVLALVEASVREIMTLLTERDRRYTDRFGAADIAVAAALAAIEKQTTASFMASEKAIVKAEDAQRDYNIRSNEFRGQLDDQAKTLLPRQEAAALLKSIEERMAATVRDHEKTFDEVKAEISSLRETRAEGAGKQEIVAPVLTEIYKDVRALREARADATGQVAGISTSWVVMLGAAGFITTLMAIGGGVYALMPRTASGTDAALAALTAEVKSLREARSVAAPQVIYVPSPPGTMLPSTPPSPVPR